MSANNDPDAPKKWTLMFYFASDNPLAASIISQLKALKAAGYHPDVNVVTQFDPQVVGTPTHVFDVNLINKIKNPNKSNPGFGTDPFVRSLMEDRLWEGDDRNGNGDSIRDLLKDIHGHPYDPPQPLADTGYAVANGASGKGRRPVLRTPAEQAAAGATSGNGANGNRHAEPGPAESLHRLLTLCAKHYKADHYMLFLLGHGMVVGNDAFLYDEHADSASMSLQQLGDKLEEFGERIKPHGGVLDLVGFHSCSVSSIEVAYQLEGKARYMLASQGPAFVGSWPYRNMLLRVIRDVQANGDGVNVEELVRDLYSYCYYNSMDYLLAGYSFDLCLSDLSGVGGLTAAPIKRLADALSSGLDDDPLLTNLILLAHWRSQSYWRENYTDLYDFCFCLRRYCAEFGVAARAALGKAASPEDAPPESLMTPTMAETYAACEDVIRCLSVGAGLVVRSEFVGPTYQYSHGLSVFFPWAQPSSDDLLWFGEKGAGSGQYSTYAFDTATGWGDFLQKYFDRTRRDTRLRELPPESVTPVVQGRPSQPLTREQQLMKSLEEDMISFLYNEEGSLNSPTMLPDPTRPPIKTNPDDAMGSGGEGSVIKNFPRGTRAADGRRVPTIPVSQVSYGVSGE